MTRLLPLALVVALAAPATAQVVPDEFPDPSDGFDDRVRRELVERHRPFLSGLFAQTSLAVGPEIGAPSLVGLVASSGGYRFASGHALALEATFRTPLGIDPLTGAPDDVLAASLGGEAVVALGRGADRASVLRGAEVGVGGALTVLAGAEGTVLYRPSVSVAPRVAIPLTARTAVPIGLRLSQELGSGVGGPYVGVSVGVRRIWADAARMVLE